MSGQIGSEHDQVAERAFAELAGVLSRTNDGIVIIDRDRRPIYANPAACRLFGRTLEQLLGQDFLKNFDPGERDRIAHRLPENSDDSVAPFFCVLTDANGVDRDVLGTASAFDVTDGHWAKITLRHVTGPGAAARIGVAMTHSAKLIEGATTEEILVGITQLAVEDTRALACGIMIVGQDLKLSVGATYGFPTTHINRTTWIESVTLNQLPSGDLLLANQSVVLPRARELFETVPAMFPFVESMVSLDWQAAAYVPLSWDGEVIGFVVVYLPSHLSGPSDSETAFYTALAARASHAIVNARLAASHERTRLARDLHDSVSQALFSMTMHARAAQLSMVKAGLEEPGPLSRSVTQLVDLTKGALAEMRALIFELRPGALAEEGLVAALGKQGAALSAREQVAITIEGPVPRLALPALVEEHLYRIVSEALHNVVKHAHADHATVTVTVEEAHIEVRIKDDGVGFDERPDRAGHLGLSTMSQRARSIGAELDISSKAGAGATVKVRVPRSGAGPRNAGPVQPA